MKYLLFVLSLIFSCAVAMGQEGHHDARMGQFKEMRAVDSTDIVLLGNALVEYGGDWNILLRYHHIRNRGIAGDDASHLMLALPSILKGKPKAIVLMVGGEDIVKGRSVDYAFERSVEVMHAIRARSPKTLLLVQSNLPVHAYSNKDLSKKIHMMAALNIRLRHYCERKHIVYLNLFRDFVRRGTNEMRKELSQDGYLLTPFGYKLWAFELRKYLVNL